MRHYLFPGLTVAAALTMMAAIVGGARMNDTEQLATLAVVILLAIVNGALGRSSAKLRAATRSLIATIEQKPPA